MTDSQNFVGLFPAGGLAKRLSISGSKEVLPVLNEHGELQPVGQFLLDAYRAADINTVHIILREQKQDIKTCFGDGQATGLDINYIELQCFWGTPYTLDQAWPMIQNKYVALGFPDIILKPLNTFQLLKTRLLESAADIVLGLFKTDRSEKSDMVDVDSDGMVNYLSIKPSETNLTYTWVTAVWRPGFTRFMHEYLASKRHAFETEPNRKEPFVGTVINAALMNNFSVQGLIIPNGKILDIGTPDDLECARSGVFFSNSTG